MMIVISILLAVAAFCVGWAIMDAIRQAIRERRSQRLSGPKKRLKEAEAEEVRIGNEIETLERKGPRPEDMPELDELYVARVRAQSAADNAREEIRREKRREREERLKSIERSD